MCSSTTSGAAGASSTSSLRADFRNGPLSSHSLCSLTQAEPKNEPCEMTSGFCAGSSVSGCCAREDSASSTLRCSGWRSAYSASPACPLRWVCVCACSVCAESTPRELRWRAAWALHHARVTGAHILVCTLLAQALSILSVPSCALPFPKCCAPPHVPTALRWLVAALTICEVFAAVFACERVHKRLSFLSQK